MKAEFRTGPTRPHGPILGIDEEQDLAWLALFNARCTLAAIAMIGLIFLFVAISYDW